MWSPNLLPEKSISSHLCCEGLACTSVFMSSLSYYEEERKHLLMLCPGGTCRVRSVIWKVLFNLIKKLSSQLKHNFRFLGGKSDHALTRVALALLHFFS